MALSSFAGLLRDNILRLSDFHSQGPPKRKQSHPWLSQRARQLRRPALGATTSQCPPHSSRSHASPAGGSICSARPHQLAAPCHSSGGAQADAATPAVEHGVCNVEADTVAREITAGTAGSGLRALLALEQRLQAVQATLIHHLAAQGRIRMPITR